MQTLAQKYPVAHANMQRNGYTSVAKLLSTFYRQSDMDRALGLTGATHNWCMQKCLPSSPIEVRAAEFLAGAVTEKPRPSTTIQRPVNSEFIVVAPMDKVASAQKLLSLMGCEVVEV